MAINPMNGSTIAAQYRICARCVMDTSDPDITFDANGVCHHCRAYEEGAKRLPRNRPGGAAKLERLVGDIKHLAKGKRYDCIIGVSGGVDSSYVAYLVSKKLGLRPLAVHLDNGWNSELAVANIERVVDRLGIHLETVVLDWNEFKSLQLAFLRASTPDSEIPTDHAIVATLQNIAAREGLQHILMGANYTTEHILVPAWSQGHGDWRYIRSVNRIHGDCRLRTFPHTGPLREFVNRVVRRARLVRILDYVEFDKAEAQRVLEDELGWRPYPGKHYESLYTRFYQGYILPRKFGFDKRRSHLSCLVCAGQMSRDDALRALQQPALYSEEIEELRVFVCKKLGLSEADFARVMEQAPKRFDDYPSYANSAAYRVLRGMYRAAFERARHFAGADPGGSTS